MPNIKSAKKRLRRSERQAESNVPFRTRVKSAGRRFNEAVASGDKATTSEAFRKYCSALDRAAKKGVIPKNRASRRKGCASNRLRGLSEKTG